MYHRLFEAGKKIHLGVAPEDLPALRKEFGEQSRGFLLNVYGVGTAAQAKELLKLMEV
jgi:hypothetical protein